MGRKVFSLVLALGLLGASFVFAQGDDLGRRDELKAQLSALQAEIEKNKQEIKARESEEKTITRDLSILTSGVKKVQLQLTQTTLALRATELGLKANSEKIVQLEGKIAQKKAVIVEIVRAIFNEDHRDIVELIVQSGNLSQFVERQKFLLSLQASLQGALVDLRQGKINVEEEQQTLEEDRESGERLKDLEEAQRESLGVQKAKQQKLLLSTRGKKAESKQVLKEKERDIEQIRNQIFLLESAGVSISLSRAYEIAKIASARTGVRPAFLLAVLKQESSWGKNVGQCYLSDLKTGAGKGKNTGATYSRTMKPSRDITPFLQITQELGRDPLNTLVSCPHSDYGYGGAMGPAQFIPSTWVVYRDRVAALVGHTPNPWDFDDAFTAAGAKLANAGARLEESPDAEWKAAMIYYAGNNWNNPAYSFYGDSVAELARAIQEEINGMGG